MIKEYCDRCEEPIGMIYQNWPKKYPCIHKTHKQLEDLLTVIGRKRYYKVCLPCLEKLKAILLDFFGDTI